MQANRLQKLRVKTIIIRKRTIPSGSEAHLITTPLGFLLSCLMLAIGSGAVAHGIPQSRGRRRPVSPSGPTPVASRMLAPISAAVQEAVRERKCPGAVILIGHGGEVVYHKAFGDRA